MDICRLIAILASLANFSQVCGHQKRSPTSNVIIEEAMSKNNIKAA
nr:hypothetical protein [Nostoc sp. EkiNYC01]